jgi:hypothetical protein
MERLNGFPPGVAEKLKTYVYRLIDPRNGETFYVGKGKGDRVFVTAWMTRRHPRSKRHSCRRTQA